MTLFKKLIVIACLLVGFTACQDRWEEHTTNEAVLGESVMQVISETPKLSKFNELVVKAGLDQELNSSKAFTVWAPSNEALQNLDQAIVNDPVRLKQFVSNHISYQQYFTHTPLPASSRIKTLSGKLIFWDRQAALVDGAGIEEANTYAGNGVLHIVNAPLFPRLNAWEFLAGTAFGQRQKAYLQSLEETVFVPGLATQIGVEPETGMPVYEPNTGYVQQNRFFQQVYNLANEDSVYSFVLLTDEAFEAETDRFRKYYTTGSADSTTTLTNWAVSKDLVFRGVYTKETIPAVLVSRSGVQVHIDKNAIVHEERTSNGVVFVVNNLQVAPEQKIKTMRVEGEAIFNNRTSRMSHPDKAGNVTLQQRRDIDGTTFTYLRATAHSISGLWLRYTLPNVPATKYKVYWRVHNDFQTALFQQQVAFRNPDATELPYIDIEPTTSPLRQEIGEYTVDRYGNLNVYLRSAMSTNNALNPLTLDYLELVPVF
ncbi:fasciclin domain-containing protein [Pontibacter qinzhouensis]|uniref:Fasciclin domain-containing protein n=1 Tax=Pontibacter qinzhouensis TaxID=2603253 RepID=A0A5C8K5I2_9BACT|nr:fasciclin domain-containing protein [Pontibacter qinzhouensis]TXK44306.1 fasciclin domain-containing protein [Pontibacter qinzhouensis]